MTHPIVQLQPQQRGLEPPQRHKTESLAFLYSHLTQLTDTRSAFHWDPTVYRVTNSGVKGTRMGTAKGHR